MAEVKKVLDNVSAWTEKAEGKYINGAFNNVVGEISAGTEAAIDVAGKATLLTLSKAWLGIGLVHRATTERRGIDIPTAQSIAGKNVQLALENEYYGSNDAAVTEGTLLDRFDETRLFSLKLGEYYMPLSQTFVLRAKKQLNVSSLVDGIDIIQQTRKEAKTIECSIRIGLDVTNENGSLTSARPNLQLVDENGAIQKFGEFLRDLFETDAVFMVRNDMINNTFGVSYVIMSDYRFVPKASSGTYTFEFSLTEVKYGDNVLTFDLTQINAPTTLTGD